MVSAVQLMTDTWSALGVGRTSFVETLGKRLLGYICFGGRRPRLLFVRVRLPFISRLGDKSIIGDKSEENLASKKGPDQSPPLGLDSRKSGACFCADGLWAQRSATVFASQQEVDARRRHGIEDISRSGDDQFCTTRTTDTIKIRIQYRIFKD